MTESGISDGSTSNGPLPEAAAFGVSTGLGIGGQCPVHYRPLGSCCTLAVRYVDPPNLAAEAERVRIAGVIRGLVGRDHCKACELRWTAGNRRHCRRCRTSYALAYAIEADAVAEHMLSQGKQT